MLTSRANCDTNLLDSIVIRGFPLDEEATLSLLYSRVIGSS